MALSRRAGRLPPLAFALAGLAVAGLSTPAYGSVPASELPSGALDPGFASGGVLVQPLGTFPNEYGTDALLQPDGKIVVLTTADEPGSFSFYPQYLSRYLPNGTLDTSFGNYGSVELPNGGNSRSYTAIALDGDGRIIVAGAEADREWHSPPGSPQGELGFGRSDGVVYRYLPNGARDSSFGTGGKALISVPPPAGLTPGSASTGPRAVSIGPDNSITIGGGVASICEWLGYPAPTEELWLERGTFVARLSNSGAPESQFGTYGLVSTHSECEFKTGVVSEYFAAMTEPSPGAPLILADEPDTWRFRFYSPAGELTEHTVSPPAVDGASGQLPLQVGTLPDHDLLVAGRMGGWQTLQRFTPEAALDPSFGQQGVTVIYMECLLCNAGTFTVMSNERILVTGVIEGQYPATGVMRFLPNGTPDESFGSRYVPGEVGVPGQAWAKLIPESNELFISNVLDLNGQPLVVGTSKNTSYPYTYTTTLALFQADGGFASNPPSPKPGEGPFSPIPNETGTNEPPTNGNQGSADTGSTGTTTNAPGAGTSPSSVVHGIQTTMPSPGSIRAALFALLHHRPPSVTRLLKTGDYNLHFDAPGPGTLSLQWTTLRAHASGHIHSRKSTLIASGTARLTVAGLNSITLRLTTAGRRLLMKAKALRVLETASFVPSGQGAQTKDATIIVRAGN